MANVEYIIKVIEPDKEYLKTFTSSTLNECRQHAQEYLWNCPEPSKYMYIATRIKNESTV